MISRRPGKLRRSGFLPPVMQNTSTHTMPARYRRDLGARFKTFRDNPRTFLGAPMPMRRRATRRLRLTMITGTFLFASMIVIIHVPSRALSSAPNDNHPTCTLGRWDARTGYSSPAARVFRHINHVVFWKMAHSLAQKYCSTIKPLIRKWYRAPEPGKAKTWIVYGINERGSRVGKALRRLVSSPKAQFRWRNPESNPYIVRTKTRNTITSRLSGYGAP